MLLSILLYAFDVLHTTLIASYLFRNLFFNKFLFVILLISDVIMLYILLGSSDLATIRSLQEFLGYMGIPNWPYLHSNFSFSSPTLEYVIGRLATYEEDIFVRFYTSPVQQPESEPPENHYFSVRIFY